MMKRTFAVLTLWAAILIIAGPLVIAGCDYPPGGRTPWSPKAKLLAARETFSGTVNSLTVLRKAGTFTKAQGEELTSVIHLGKLSLDQWEAAIELKQPTAGPVERFNYALREMTAAKIGAERRVAK